MSEQLDTLVEHFRAQGAVVLLESQSDNHSESNISYLAAQPKTTIKARGHRIEIQTADGIEVIHKNPWEALSDFREQQGDWLFGYLGYDLKNHIEKLHSQNEDALDAPDLYFMVPEILLRVDSKRGELEMLKGTFPDNIASGTSVEKAEIRGLHSGVDKETYLAMIEEVKKKIFEGDYYELNLSHQLQGKFTGDPFQLYKKMRAIGPVPFASFLQFDDYSVCSLSPERFLAKKGETVFSQPIKGTMKRDSDKKADEKLRQKLIDSSKNRAENLMIVDLVRNDLSRIARSGSVEVDHLFEIQTFGTVHQMVSTVKAQTGENDPVQIIKACYPMGSMTGAPKIRVMQSIERLENYRRGIYSGAIGYFSPQGDFDFSVVIRTALIKNTQLYYSVGGAVTSDSDPQNEWDETWLKARALTEAYKKEC